MAYSNKDKLYTDNPMMDELVHACKIILQDIVLKDQVEADNNESLESIEESDIFMAIKSGNQRFSTFQYTEEILKMLNVFTQDEINNYSIDNSLIPEEYRDKLLSIASDLFLDQYVEQNNYYRSLNGKPDYGTLGLYVQIEDIPEEYRDQFDFSKTIDEFDNNQIAILRSLGILDIIKENNKDLNYLNHLGEKSIDIYLARKAPPFGLLYINNSIENIILQRFKEILETNRIIYLKRHYSTAYRFTSDYYEKVMIILIISQTVSDLLIEIPEWYIRRDVFDIRTCQFILESNGVKFFKEIPLKYQIALVRNLNQIVKYKSCNKNIYDICELFDLKDAKVYKYFLLKKRKLDGDKFAFTDKDLGEILDLNGRYSKDEASYEVFDGGNARRIVDNDYEVFDGGSTASMIEPDNVDSDLDKMYELLFVRTPIEELFDNYSRDNVNNLKYDFVTMEDKYWDGENDHDYVKQEILKKDFTVESTKYLSVESITSSKDYSFQLKYFLNLLFNNKIDKNTLNTKIPIINSDASFNLVDLFILIYILNFNYYNPSTPDIILNKNRYNPDPVPIPEPEDIYFGDYDPEKLNDYICDGRFAKDELNYYKVNGGKSYIDEDADIINIDGGVTEDTTYNPFYDPSNPDKYINKYLDKRWKSYNGAFADGVEIYDFELSGGSAADDEYEYYENIQGGHGARSVVDLDYPEQDEDIVDLNNLDDQIDAMSSFGFIQFLDLNGGESSNDIDTTDIYIIDGGRSVNSYINTYKSINPKIYADPCEYYKEWCDKKDQTLFIDTYDRLFGFNLYADMEWLQEVLSNWVQPKFNYLRGYTLEELGVENFLIPSNEKINSVDELMNIYNTNKDIYDKLLSNMMNVDTEDEYRVYEFVYKYLFTMEMNQDYFIKSDGNMAIYYSEFLKDKDFVLYSFYKDIISENDITSRQYLMNEKIDLIIDSIKEYLNTTVLTDLFGFVPIKSKSLLLQYASLLINFFKSYKVTMIENGNTLDFDEESENKVVINDKIAYIEIETQKYDTLSTKETIDIEIETEPEDKVELQESMIINEIYDELIDLDGGDGTPDNFIVNRYNIDGNQYIEDPYNNKDQTLNSFVDFNGCDAKELLLIS